MPESTAKTTAADQMRSDMALDAVLEGIGEGFFALDPDWRFIAFNRAAEQTFNLARQDVLGRTLWEVSPGLPGSEYERRYRTVMTDRVKQEFKTLSVYLEKRYHEVRAFPLGAGIGVGFRDVTERYEIEEALRESERNLKLDIAERARIEEQLREREAELARVQRIAQVGGLDVDLRDGFRTRRPPEYLRLHGLPPEAVNEPHEAWIDRIHPEDRESTVARFQAEVNGGADEYNAEYRIVRPSDGEIRWISATAEIHRDAEGRASKLIGAHLDITDRKRAEIALKESEARFRMIADSAPVPMWVTMRDGKRSFANKAYCEFLGLPFDEALEFDWNDAPHPDDLERVLAERKEGEASRRPFMLEARYRRADGEWRWLRSESRPRGADEDEELGFIGVAHDITVSKQAEIQLRRMNETLEQRVAERTHELQAAEETLRHAQKMEAIGQLTGGVAHDFNNLLQGIIGSLDVIKRRVSQGRTGDLERLVDSAMHSANRASALTHRLLAFARRQPLDPRPVSANTLIGSMEDLLRRSMGERIAVELFLAAGLWSTLCDANQLENAILNLAINARDAMPDGGRLAIETCNAHLDGAYAARQRELSPGQYVCVSITDTGTGMAGDVLARAFDPFFTTKPTGQGTGLGLSMIYGFARQSNGHAKIYSEAGRGTTVKIYLPRHRGDLPKDEEISENAGEHAALDGEVVLVVEDDDVVRELIVEMLGELGYRPLEAQDGPGALEILKKAPRIDLLVTDIGLPGLNGRQVADAARVRSPALKVLFMTGYAENAAVSSGFLEPGMQMLTKPFPMEALASRIKAMIEDRA